MEKISLSIDGKQIDTDKGTTILAAALASDIYIPHLCFYPGLSPKGACRLCMVEVNDSNLLLACQTLVEEGMEVKTATPEVEEIVKPIVELLIADHHANCGGCPASGKCELQKVMSKLHIDRQKVKSLRPPKEELPFETFNDYLSYDPNKCICCGICVQTCQDMFETGSLYFVNRGYGTKIAFFGDDSRCKACLECIHRCPVGVLFYSKM